MPDPAPTPDTPEIAKLKAEAALLKAQAEQVKATAELTKANAELAAANKPPAAAVVASNAEKARLDAAKGVLESSKALADARKAADLSAVQAAIGTVAGSTIEGTVTLKQDAGKSEASLLAAKALQTAAATIVAAVQPQVSGRRVILLQGAEIPQFANYRQFLMQQGLLQRAFEVAREEADPAIMGAERLLATPGPVQGEALAPLTVAGAAIDAAAKLGSYFMTNYESGGIALTPDVEQLAAAVSQLLLQQNPRPASINLPSRRTPRADDFSAIMQQLADNIRGAGRRADEAIELAARLKERLGAADDAGKARLQKAAKSCEDAAAALRKAISKTEEFAISLGTADAKGVVLITKIAQEKFVADTMAPVPGQAGPPATPGALALLLDVRSTAGGYYTKKNLWTFFGAMPFYVMGGVVVTYYLVDQDGDITASGLVPVHGSYRSVADVAALFP
jgi:hypothetical protein